MAALTHTVSEVNDELVAQARSPAVTEIQRLLDGVTQELDKVSADPELRGTATGELSKLLATATSAKSIAHITQARLTAEAAYDRALSAIEKAQIPSPPPEPGVTPPPPQPPLKKRRVVEARSFWSGGFIETKADVDAFLTKLRTELEAAINADERVQIK